MKTNKWPKMVMANGHAALLFRSASERPACADLRKAVTGDFDVLNRTVKIGVPLHFTREDQKDFANLCK